MVYEFLTLKQKENDSLFMYKNEKVFSSSKKVGLKITNINVKNILNLRVNYRSLSFQNYLKKVLKFEIPKNVGIFKNNGKLSLLAIGPSELLLIIADDKNIFSKSNYEKLLNNFSNVTDVTDHYHSLNLSGDKLRWVLSKGCSVDLNKSVFRPGSCVQTLLGNSNVIFTCNSDNSITLVCVSSYIEYVLRWLKDAANQEGYFFLTN